MTRRSNASLAASLSLVLGACGGGGGSSGPSVSLAFSPSRVVIQTTQGVSETVNIVVTATGETSDAVYVVIEDVEQILSGTPSVQQDGSRFNVEIVTSNALSPGRYLGDFRIFLCRDASCVSTIDGSPYRLPYDITVDEVELTSLLAYQDDTGLKLLDPRLAVSENNPVLVDPGNPEATLGASLLGADWDGMQLRNLQTIAHVYKNNDRIYRLNLSPAASHAPVQISSIDTACDVERIFQDYRTPDNGWVLVHVRDVNGECGQPRSYRLIRANESPTSSGVTPNFVWSNQIQAIHSADGSIVGFLTFETPFIVRRDADLDNPTEVLEAYTDGSFDYGGLSQVSGDFTDNLYFVSREPDDADPALFRYGVSDGTLVRIANYGTPFVPTFPIGAVDGENFYWGGGGSAGALFRVAHTSTVPFRMSSPDVTTELRDPVLTDSKVLVEWLRSGSNGGSGVYAFDKSAENELPSVVLDPNNGGSTRVTNADPGGTLLITNARSQTGFSYVSYVARDDGLVLQTLSGARWRMRVYDGIWDPIGRGATRYVLEGAGSGVFEPRRRIFDAVTGQMLAELPGITNNDQATSGPIGFGRYIPFDVRVRKGTSSWDWDAYVIDSIAGAQSPVLVDPESGGYAVLSDWDI